MQPKQERASRRVGRLYPRTNARQGRAPRMVRRGISLLEIVFAVALLGMVAASIAGTFGFATMYQLRERQRLAAAEVAHRLLLSYLDDPTEMPDPTRPVEYGPPEAPARFRWTLSEAPVGVIEIAGDQRDPTRHSPLSMDRFQIITVQVWLSEESGGSRQPDGNAPMAVLSRMLDPIAIRNPDSTMNMLGSERGRQRWMEAMMNMGGQAGAGGSAGQRRAGEMRASRLSGSGARDAFRRGPSGMGGQRVPFADVRARTSPGGSFNPSDFPSDLRRRR